MTTDYICYIIHATITNFGIIKIEDIVIFMNSTKMFIQYEQKLFRNIGFRIGFSENLHSSKMSI